MPEPTPIPRTSPFDAAAPALPAPTPGVMLHVRRDLKLYALRGNPRNAAFLSAARAALGCALPLTANTISVSPACTVLWTGPDAWLISGHNGAGLRQAPDIAGGWITDVSHGHAGLRMTGPDTRELLAKGCALDLAPTVFQAGQCAQGTLAHVNVLIHLRDTAGSFDLYCARSYAAGLRDWLVSSASDLGCGIGPPL